MALLFHASLTSRKSCGRYYDEITNDFGSNDSDRIEYLKTITMVSVAHGP